MNIETIFEFIRFSIDEHAPAFHPADDVDWQEIYDFGRKQSIVGVLFQGVARLPKDFQADRKVRLKWFMQAEKIRKKNERMNKETVELYNMLLKDGFRSCVLKGQAVACLYPDPYLRSAGDIDIWVDADRDAIVKYVTNHFPKQKQRYIHIDFPVFAYDSDLETYYLANGKTNETVTWEKSYPQELIEYLTINTYSLRE